MEEGVRLFAMLLTRSVNSVAGFVGRLGEVLQKSEMTSSDSTVKANCHARAAQAVASKCENRDHTVDHDRSLFGYGNAMHHDLGQLVSETDPYPA